MDATDAALLRFFTTPAGFQWDVRASFSKASRALALTEDTVRGRWQRLQEQGVVEGWHVMVNPAALGMQFVRVEVQIPDGAEKDRLLARLRHLDGVHILFDYHGTGLAAVFYCRPGDEERLARLVESLTDAPLRTVAVATPRVQPAPEPADWRFIRLLRHSPRAPLQELAEATGTSTKTVQRRLERLQAGRMVFLTVHTDFSRMDAGILLEVRLGLGADADMAAWRERVEAWPGVIFSNVSERTLVASRVVRSPMEATELRRALEDEEELAWCAVDIIQRREVVDDWLDHEVARRVQEALV